MNLENEQQLRSTEDKIRLLQRRLQEVKSEKDLSSKARDLIVLSLNNTINEMKEDIVRYRSRMTTDRHRESA